MILPNEIKKLNDDLVVAFYELEEYSQIFRESKARIDLLNKVAPNFFVKLHDLFWNNFILTVSRFTDPSGKSNNQNLSLDILRKYHDELNQVDKNTITYNLETIKKEAKQIRKFRSKYISHRDLDYALLVKNDIGTIDLKKIEDIYKLIGDSLNIFNMHYSRRTILYQGLRTNPGARSLLYFIKEGIIYTEFKARRKNLFLNEEEINQSKYKDA
jgi:hypothetical protein